MIIMTCLKIDTHEQTITIVSKDKWIPEVRVGVAREFPTRILP